MNDYFNAWKKYAVFSGRARRKEYWDFVLFNILFYVILSLIDARIIKTYNSLGFGILSGLFILAIIIPLIAVEVRRFHDIDKSGWWYLLNFVPFIGIIVTFIFTLINSTPGENKYGPNPKEITNIQTA